MAMTTERQLRISHIILMVQYLLSAGVVIVWVLLRTGLHWSIVFSLSTQGFVLVALCVLIYGFSVFRGAVGERRTAEFPFTSSTYYRFGYLLLPVLGGVVGAIDFSLAVGPRYVVLGLSFGTVVVASVMWLLVDPAIGIVESALPESRKLRATRLSAERERQERHRHQKRQLLTKLLAEREARLEELRPLLMRHTQRLKELIVDSVDDPLQGSEEAATIGLSVWQLAGPQGMKDVYQATALLCIKSGRDDLIAYLDYWWDGVGEWRRGLTAPETLCLPA